MQDDKYINGKWLSHVPTLDGSRISLTYKTWAGMKYRCSKTQGYYKIRPSYSECTISPEFLDFQNFANWMTAQVGYGETGYNLDKDILIKGNKIYSESTCVLVPGSLNKFFTDTRGRRGIYPQGVSYYKKSNKFQSRISIDDHQKWIGHYDTVEEAEQAYIEAKETEAKRWANRLIAGEFIVDQRVITALQNWKLH